MGFDSGESVQALFGLLAIGQEILKDAKELPPKAERKAVDYAELVGAAPDGALAKLLEEIDDPVHNAADLIPILGLNPDGNLGTLLTFADRVIKDVED